MTFNNRLLTASVSLEDVYDRLIIASSLFESGIAYLDGSGISKRSSEENNDRGLYLLDLYQQEVGVQLENLRAEIDWLKTQRASLS